MGRWIDEWTGREVDGASGDGLVWCSEIQSCEMASKPVSAQHAFEFHWPGFLMHSCL